MSDVSVEPQLEPDLIDYATSPVFVSAARARCHVEVLPARDHTLVVDCWKSSFRWTFNRYVESSVTELAGKQVLAEVMLFSIRIDDPLSTWCEFENLEPQRDALLAWCITSIEAAGWRCWGRRDNNQFVVKVGFKS